MLSKDITPLTTVYAVGASVHSLHAAVVLSTTKWTTSLSADQRTVLRYMPADRYIRGGFPILYLPVNRPVDATEAAAVAARAWTALQAGKLPELPAGYRVHAGGTTARAVHHTWDEQIELERLRRERSVEAEARKQAAQDVQAAARDRIIALAGPDLCQWRPRTWVELEALCQAYAAGAARAAQDAP